MRCFEDVALFVALSEKLFNLRMGGLQSTESANGQLQQILFPRCVQNFHLRRYDVIVCNRVLLSISRN